MATQRYLVTARKYRPQVFEELVAQEHVTETLKNAIRLDRLAHAYLFSGPRGVGKTTAARILAKAINCTTPLDERDGGAEPCRTCESCRTFEEARSLNIIEIDAASNNRVDDIRDLRDTVRVPPQGGRKKVYIIDEVHMLSAAAFNALLKTLEEPPPHVLFIFATTEPHKVLPTILSRCQRFDFRRIAVPEIVERLREICSEEDISADEASLMLVARKGDGALRDALSVFDQAVSLCGSDLQYADLAQALGVVDVDLYFDVTDFVLERDAAGMLRLVDGVVGSGYDLQEFLAGLAEHLRNLLVARVISDASLIEAAEVTRERYASVSSSFTEADLLRLLTLVSDAEESIKNNTQQRLRLETALLKMATISLAADLSEALEKLDRLENMAREGKLPSDTESGTTTGNSSSGSAETSAQTDSGRTRQRKSQASEGGLNTGQSGAASEASLNAGQGGSASADSSATGQGVSASDEISATGQGGSASTGSSNTGQGGAVTRGSSRTEQARSEQARSVPGGSSSGAVKSRLADDGGSHAKTRSDEGRGSPEGMARPDAGGQVPSGSADAPQPEETGMASPAASQAGQIFGKPALQRKPPTTPNASGKALEGGSDVALADGPDAGPLEEIWEDLVVTVSEDRIHVGSLLRHSRPEQLLDGSAVVGVPDDFHHRLLSHQHDYLLGQLEPLLSAPIRSIRFAVREDLEAPAAEETASDFDPYEYMQRKRQENPVIRAIFDQFGGELVW